MKKWYVCPYCNKKIIKYREDAKSKRRLFIMQEVWKRNRNKNKQ